MNKVFILGGFVTLIGAIILFLYKDNQETKIELAKEKEFTKQQKIEIETKDEIIRDNKQIYKRRQKNKSIKTVVIKNEKIDLSNPSLSNLAWLYEHRNKDRKS